jgi:hypothetical protein
VAEIGKISSSEYAIDRRLSRFTWMPQLGIRTVPAVVINGTLAACCTDSGPDEATLRVAGLGQAL